MNSYRIPEIAKIYLEHDMIQKHTDLPHFPEFRSRLLYAFLDKHSTLTKQSELYTLVTSLVQIGMDTHDMVSVNNDVKEQAEARSRQLKVLAGDYYSSRFYFLLSHAGHIDLVGKLSKGICEVNRLKMNLYIMKKQLKLTADEYIRQMVEVKTQLFLSFSSLLEERFNGIWPEVLRLFTRCEVLMQEIIRSETSQQYRESWGFWHVLQWGTKEEKKLLEHEEADQTKLRSIWLKYKVTSQLYQLLDACFKELQEKLQGIEPEKLSKELFSIGEPFRSYLTGPRATQEI
ncbi:MULTISPECIES: heptaprenyl diphosphate synthase component 1 [unclassified Paenibacillus]|uniref:heptaprenyl diphosphate synthase component 1 n=1 Tax=unclassified Paenibacillus TaxID=185978 RepID=UPI001AE6935D|nr:MULTISPECIES: heptaprenyl diphosphate synthase component 1 [unclassified Paenibacillus]MBP1155258.1 heptaprenyl diphosphate synthase [Paenibacillus sp. PvP091]MBP1169358.1 heptaprenyl diphosphate synthase [Paenibacillus sp. PvR098]MBP2440386.1 heptaprenyl diphosphate synthase [Paenibacillus sp. PvP052]